MELDKLKQWLDVAQQYQSQNFWNQIFTEKNAHSTESSNGVNLFSLPQEYAPKCDLFETDNSLVAEVEIPGLNNGDVQVSLFDQTLTIIGEFKALQPKGKYYLKERVNRKFKKEITLPYPILLHESKSDLINGVLTITMPFNRDDLEVVPISFESSPE